MSLQQNNIYQETIMENLLEKYNIIETSDGYIGTNHELRNFFIEAERLEIL